MLRTKIEHYFHPLHIFCRLRDIKIPKKYAMRIGKLYEKLYKLIFH